MGVDAVMDAPWLPSSSPSPSRSPLGEGEAEAREEAREKAVRLAARLASGAKRVCKTSDCSTILSVYNDDDICSRCFDAIPVNERPYKYRASF